ncbi:MAG TPA: SLBB domain-containing protein [Acidimicrobiia bacterium]|nr:SLBB domain-containing protein [Acidimicrobiia bacterium]
MPEPEPPRLVDAPDDGLVPDPTFWGPGPAAPNRHRRRRPPTVTERVTAAVPSRDARTAIAALVAVLVITTVLVSYRARVPGAAPPVSASPNRVPAPTRVARAAPAYPRHVVVHVAGAVTHPGVVTLPGGDRVIDAIDTAGGARPDANLDALNLAARLRDGEQVLVPATADTTTTTTPAAGPGAPPTTVAPR